MTGEYRIAKRGTLSGSRTISFTFDGRSYEGLEGDTLASALLANGVHLMGRSFKYHRPRGVLAAGVEEPNALVGITRNKARHVPNVRASVQELYDGLTATSQNRFPSLHFDIGAVNSLMSPFFPAGFYYKTFKWPAAAWDTLYEPFIRRAAGLGEAPTEADTDRYSNRFAHCDVLVIGGGAAGLMAAKMAADKGKSVVICDENPALGGWLLSDSDITIDGQTGPQWAAAMAADLAAHENVRVLTRTTGFGYFQQNMVALAERVTEHMAKPDSSLPRERLWQVRAGQVVIAQGAIERHMVFPDNDRPGITLAGAAQTWLNRYGVAVGKRVGVFTACDTAYQAAFDLAEEGIDIPLIADTRDSVSDDIRKQAEEFDIEILIGAQMTGTSGRAARELDDFEWRPGRRGRCHHRLRWLDTLSASLLAIARQAAMGCHDATLPPRPIAAEIASASEPATAQPISPPLSPRLQRPLAAKRRNSISPTMFQCPAA